MKNCLAEDLVEFHRGRVFPLDFLRDGLGKFPRGSEGAVVDQDPRPFWKMHFDVQYSRLRHGSGLDRCRSASSGHLVDDEVCAMDGARYGTRDHDSRCHNRSVALFRDCCAGLVGGAAHSRHVHELLFVRWGQPRQAGVGSGSEQGTHDQRQQEEGTGHDAAHDDGNHPAIAFLLIDAAHGRLASKGVEVSQGQQQKSGQVEKRTVQGKTHEKTGA